MRIFTNPGSNLSERQIAHYNILVAPQHIVVNGVSHDTRMPRSLTDVDEWVKASPDFPYVVGTTAQEFTDLYVEAFKQERDLLGVFTTKKIIRSYQAAESAVRSLSALSKYAQCRVSLVDSGVTDVGAGVITIAAAEAARAGMNLPSATGLLERMSRQGKVVFYIHDLQMMVKSGRASFLRAWLAEKLDRRPLLGFVDGEVGQITTVRTTNTPASLLVDAAEKSVGGARRVWVGISHGGNPAQASECLSLCKQRFKVEFSSVRVMSSSIYLAGGPRCLLLAVYPVDRLGTELPRPAPGLDGA